MLAAANDAILKIAHSQVKGKIFLNPTNQTSERSINAGHRRIPLMNIDDIPFATTDWANVPVTEHKGEKGTAYWRTCQLGSVRVRMVEYSPGYLADHWCSKGHILLCLEGELLTELKDGRLFVLKPGVSYQVADNAEAHRSSTLMGARLFVVD